MLVLHGFWDLRGRLCLWAEDAERLVSSKSEAYRSARPHPFAVPSHVLTELLPGTEDTAVLQLPSLRKSPLDSPEMLRITPRPTPKTEPALMPWIIPIVSLKPADALQWLTNRALHYIFRAGASLQYLTSLAAWAQELMRNGRVVPHLAQDAAGPRACWRPVLQGADVLVMQSLTNAMPPVCRAQPEQHDPHELTADALGSLVDAATRSALADVSLVPPRRGRRPQQLPAAEAWLEALTQPGGRFQAAQAELAKLEQALRPWQEVASAQIGPARATFRLAETLESDIMDDPAHDAGHAETMWQLEFLLQSTTDPSLLVPADQVWSDDGALKRWLATPQETLLTELGRANNIYPELAHGLRQARPESLILDTRGAYQFLTEAAPALDEAGFGVLLPSWWDRRAGLGLKLSASTPADEKVAKPSAFGREQLCDFQWKLAVGDHELTQDEIDTLARVKAPLVRLRGQWVSVNSEQLRRGLEFLGNQRAGQQKTVAQILALAATHPDDVDAPMAVTTIEADGWLGALLDGTAAQSIEPVEPPAGLEAQLRPYQQRGLSWLAFLSSIGLGACLADDMGLGKTLQLLALEVFNRTQDPSCGPTLLLCPMSLVGNWQREAAKFAPDLRIYAHHGPSRLRGTALHEGLAEVDLVITTYGTAQRDIDDLASVAWGRLVLDEAQAIKNSLSRSSKTVRRLQATHRVALTGTPMENQLSEMWSIMDFLNPGMLGSQEIFRTRYAIPVERYGDDDAAQRLRSITQPYILRRLKTDPAIIDDLPEKIELKQYCKLTTEQASLYQSVVDDMMEKIEDSTGIQRRGNVLAAMAKLKQVCNHPAQLLHDRSAIGHRSGKVARLEELLDEILAKGDQVLCFTQYTEFAEMLLPHLATRFDTDVGYLHGGTTKKRRDEMVQQFQSGDGPPIFLLSLKAGGTGLNLTAANHVIHLDRWWNPAVEDQATDRAFRIGQKQNVQVHKFVCTGTIEERIDDMIEEKKALANLVVSDGESWMTELSTAELRDMFTLSEGAVGE